MYLMQTAKVITLAHGLSCGIGTVVGVKTELCCIPGRGVPSETHWLIVEASFIIEGKRTMKEITISLKEWESMGEAAGSGA
jgi:hypothetical protein